MLSYLSSVFFSFAHFHVDYLIGNKGPLSNGSIEKNGFAKDETSGGTHQFAFDNPFFRDDDLDSSSNDRIKQDHSKVQGMFTIIIMKNS